MLEDTEPTDSSGLERQLLAEVPREPEDSRACGVFVRPLKEEEFEKHVRGWSIIRLPGIAPLILYLELVL
jgi:hypothetical protein